MKLKVPPSGYRRSLLTTAVLVTTFALSGVAAWALTSSSNDLAQPERITQIAQGDGIEVDAASVEVTVSETASNVVAVPKSMMMIGPPYFSKAATASVAARI